MTDDVQYSVSIDDSDVLKSLDKIDKEIEDIAKTGQKSFDKIGKSASKSGKDISGSFLKVSASILSAVGSISAAAVTVKKLTDTAIEAEKVFFDLGVSANTAAREFGTAVGTAKTWEQTLSRIREETKIYSSQDLAGATSSLIDMTKQLGLTEQQMSELLERTIDLSAGKDNLQNVIKQASGALQGEAGSAKALGVNLDKSTVEDYAKAQGLVLEELSNAEVVQLRYNILLDQTAEIQGRAAKFAETLAGKEAIRNARLEDQAVILGEQLLPLREGYVELLDTLSSETEDTGSIITQALAGIAAAAGTFVVAIKSAFDLVKIEFAGLKAAGEALINFEDPIAAAREEIAKFQAEGDNAFNVLTNLPTVLQQSFDQIQEGWAEQRRQARQTADELANTDIVIDEDGAEIGIDPEELNKALDKLGELEADAANKRIDIIRKAGQKRLDTEEDFIEKRLDTARDFLRRIEDIERKNADAISDSGTDLRRDEEDAQRDFNRRQVEIEKNSAKNRIKIEENFREDIRKIQSNFEADSEEAARNRDAVTFLRLQRDRDRQIDEAKIVRNQRVDENRQEGQEKREQLKQDLEFELEDARIADERRLEDLGIRLERELEAARINNERELQDLLLNEDRKREELQTSLDRQLQEARIANDRRVADYKGSLDEEVLALVEAEQRKTKAFKKGEEDRAKVRQQSNKTSTSQRFTLPQYLVSPGRQRGGPVGAGQSVVVGERGPEVITPQVQSMVSPSITNFIRSPQFSSSVVNNISPTINQEMTDQSAIMRAIARNEAMNYIQGVLGSV